MSTNCSVISQRPAALVISLDFEGYWGVSDFVPDESHPYWSNIEREGEVVERLLEVFAQREIHATWATVGGLFADDAEELSLYAPDTLPQYRNRALDNYERAMVVNEKQAELYFSPNLVKRIASTLGQEVASHTFSHYYCLEQGQDLDTFKADMNAAKSIAEKFGIELKSVVFPKNQVNRHYLPVLAELDLNAYRGNPDSFLYRPIRSRALGALRRTLRFMDAFANLGGHQVVSWESLGKGFPKNIRASRFLRPVAKTGVVATRLRNSRVAGGLRAAVRKKGVFHLWWHPHNFGGDLNGELQAFAGILDVFEQLRDSQGMLSLNMRECASMVDANEYE